MPKILSPVLPLQTGIPGGIYDGKMIEIKGKVPDGAERFEINLMARKDLASDRPLHLSIRFDQRCVVRNHKQNDEWGPEERQGPFPFSIGRDFTMLIVIEKRKYRIDVNNQHCWDFPHRLPMDRVQYFSMRGFFEVYQVEFIDRPNTSVPIEQSVRTKLPPVYSPNIPYAYPIYDGLEPGMTIYINGQPPSNPYRFTINLQKGAAQSPPPDIAFHFDPRFFNRSVVRNSRYNGAWATEENYISHFPFKAGISFELVIHVEADQYSVFINGQHFTDFQHRLKPLEKFDTLYIENDVSISSIRFS